MHDRGKRFHLGLLFSRPLFKFLEVYVLKRGFKDGLPGLIIAVSDAYAMFVRYVKLSERGEDQFLMIDKFFNSNNYFLFSHKSKCCGVST
jgi:hypothetical protein